MSGPLQPSLRRGWCPSALAPMATGDGLLTRFHPPGGRLTLTQLQSAAGLARNFGNGRIEVSRRANLQIRGATSETHPLLARGALASGLVRGGEGAGPQRLTITSPLAGLDSSDFLDAATLAREIEALRERFPALHSKTCVIVDGGGHLSLDTCDGDARLRAISRRALALQIGDRWFGLVNRDEAVALIESLLRRLNSNRDGSRRLRDLDEADFEQWPTLQGASPPPVRPTPFRAGIAQDNMDAAALLLGFPFGAIHADALAALAQSAADCGADGAVLSVWRGLAFTGMTNAAAERLQVVAAEMNLIVDPVDPRFSVQACVGRPACARAETDAQRDAAELAMAMHDMIAAGATLHVSGCVKGCAQSTASDLTLVGRDGVYDVILDGAVRDDPVARCDIDHLHRRLATGGDWRARILSMRPRPEQRQAAP